MASPTGHPMGVHVSWSGSALATVDAEAVLAKGLYDGGRCSRIDLALDVREELPIVELHYLFEAGAAISQARQSALFIQGDGKTCYIGSRSSQKFLRIYDKRAQTGSQEPWTRIELECKAEFARTIAEHVATAGLQNVPAIIRGFADWPTQPQWVACTASPTLSKSTPKAERRKDTRAWLLTSVAPALAKQLKASTDFAREWQLRMAALETGVGEGEEIDIFDGKADFDIKW